MLLKSELKRRAGKLRKNPTPSERALWSRLRRHQLGVKFRRQHVLAPYIVDFYCHSEKLVVEVDGPVHDEASEDADKRRDEALERNHKITKVLRFSAQEVVTKLDDVVEEIERVLEEEASDDM
ncbi:MAG: endonuclease domain-containing protein [Persicimonas sp.]